MNLPEPTRQMFEQFIDNGLKKAVFDFDGTLACTDITKLYFFMRRKAFRNAVAWNTWKYCQYGVYGPTYLLIDRIDRATFQRIFYRRYESFTASELASAAKTFFAARGEQLLNEGVCTLLQWLKHQGIEVEIHTTNMAGFVKPFAVHLGVSSVALPLEETPSGCRVDTSNLRHFKIDALKLSDSANTAVIADSISDLPAFRSVAFPVLVSDRIPRWADNLPVITPQAQLLRGCRRQSEIGSSVI